MQVSGVCDFSHLENKAEQGSEQPITCWHESTQSLGLELGHPELPVSAEAQSTSLVPNHCLLPLLLTWGEQPYLVCLDKVKVFPMDPKAMFKISTFFLAPGTKLICSRKKKGLEEMCRILEELHVP